MKVNPNSHAHTKLRWKGRIIPVKDQENILTVYNILSDNSARQSAKSVSIQEVINKYFEGGYNQLDVLDNSSRDFLVRSFVVGGDRFEIVSMANTTGIFPIAPEKKSWIKRLFGL